MAQPLHAPVDEHLTKPRPLVFPTEAQVPESKDHVLLRTALFLVLTETFADTAWIGSEQFVYYDASDPSRVVAPDVFVRRGGPDESFVSWKVWERGCPELAIEIISSSDASAAAWDKKLAHYHAVGVAELVRFHADATPSLRIWDRVEEDLIERRTDGCRAACRVLGCDFVVVDRALRLSREGTILPTPSERAAREAERANRLRAKLVAAGIDPEELATSRIEGWKGRDRAPHPRPPARNRRSFPRVTPSRRAASVSLPPQAASAAFTSSSTICPALPVGAGLARQPSPPSTGPNSRCPSNTVSTTIPSSTMR